MSWELRHSEMSIGILSLGKEDNEDHSSLVSFYLGHRANESYTQENPGLKVYQGIVLGHVQVAVYEYSDWDAFDNDSQGSQNRLQETDIVVIKFSVNDKASFLNIKNHFVPVVKQIFSHSFVPVMVLAIGTRQNDGPFCTCPMCNSDREISVTTNEGLQLAKDIGATYLELLALNYFYVVKYFGGVLEYYINKTIHRKSALIGKKTKNWIKPPSLLLPEKMPVLKHEPSRYISDIQDLLVRCQCADVIFCTADLRPVCGAHRVVLCSVSPVFAHLFAANSCRNISDPCIYGTAHFLFSLYEESAGTAHNSSVRVIVKDCDFQMCLPSILNFIYSGASKWELLEQQIKEKLKNEEKVEHVCYLVQCVLKKRSLVRTLTDESFPQCKNPLQMCESLGQFFNNPLLADVIFQVQDSKIPAHRAVLVARCDVMSAMFSGSYSEANQIVIPIHDMSKDTFLAFLEYIYKDSYCPASILQAMSLMICSEMYQVSRLQHACEHFIITQLQSMPSRELSSSSLSVVSLLKKAKFYNSESLYTWLLSFIAAHYLIFSQKTDFQDLSAEELEFVEKHRWPSNFYLNQLAEYRRYIHSPKNRCVVL
ncbi:rho-related BTB domain-containing protein 3 isoform X3 [Lithobates pipiens]